jgi:hypothetical protein
MGNKNSSLPKNNIPSQNNSSCDYSQYINSQNNYEQIQQSLKNQLNNSNNIINALNYSIKDLDNKINNQNNIISQKDIKISELNAELIKKWKENEMFKLNGIKTQYNKYNDLFKDFFINRKDKLFIIIENNNKIKDEFNYLTVSDDNINNIHESLKNNGLKLLNDSDNTIQKIFLLNDKNENDILIPINNMINDYNDSINNLKESVYYNKLLELLEKYNLSIKLLDEYFNLSEKLQDGSNIILNELKSIISKDEKKNAYKDMYNSVTSENKVIDDEILKIDSKILSKNKITVDKINDNSYLIFINKTLFICYWILLIVLIILEIYLKKDSDTNSYLFIKYISLILFPFVIGPFENLLLYIWNKFNNIIFVSI